MRMRMRKGSMRNIFRRSRIAQPFAEWNKPISPGKSKLWALVSSMYNSYPWIFMFDFVNFAWDHLVKIISKSRVVETN